jgi:hypothetical protein
MGWMGWIVMGRTGRKGIRRMDGVSSISTQRSIVKQIHRKEKNQTYR